MHCTSRAHLVGQQYQVGLWVGGLQGTRQGTERVFGGAWQRSIGELPLPAAAQQRWLSGAAPEQAFRHSVRHSRR